MDNQNKKERVKAQWRAASLRYYYRNNPDSVIRDIVKAKKDLMYSGIPVSIDEIISEIRVVLEDFFKRVGGKQNG